MAVSCPSAPPSEEITCSFTAPPSYNDVMSSSSNYPIAKTNIDDQNSTRLKYVDFFPKQNEAPLEYPNGDFR